MTITPSGEVGSVGVRMMHLDVSKAMEDAGLKVTELYSGDFKTEWSPYKALSEEAIGDMQKRLTATHTDFLNAVAGAGVGPACPRKCAAIAWGKVRIVLRRTGTQWVTGWWTRSKGRVSFTAQSFRRRKSQKRRATLDT